jgi:DNA processing protein
MVTNPAESDALIRLAFSGIGLQRLLRVTKLGPERALRRLGADTSLAESQRAGLAVDASARRAQLVALGIRFTELDAQASGMSGGAVEPPRWLFLRGTLPMTPGVAVVGSRRATSYGLAVARQIGFGLADAGLPVISGLALGIDGAAHRGCLAAGGITIAVLGSGVDVLYPIRHRQLAQEILDSGGAVVSEYPPGTRPEPWRFPERNRIIAGMSRAVVVVEAAERSGALITARLALDMNLDVFAVPGDIDRPTSRGANQLIRDGAHPVCSIEELLEGLGFAATDWAPLEDLGLEVGERVAVEDLVARHPERAIPEVMSAIAHLELEGRLRVEGGYVEVPRQRRVSS